MCGVPIAFIVFGVPVQKEARYVFIPPVQRQLGESLSYVTNNFLRMSEKTQ